jgi:hypothetical protein
MVAALPGWFVLLAALGLVAVLGLGFYAVYRMGPGSFRLRTSVLRLFSFSMEIESPGVAGKSSGKPEQRLCPDRRDGSAVHEVDHEAPPGDC